jgi:hypothetical protein
MSKSKIVGMIALIAFAMGIFLVGDALAGEKVKGRIVCTNSKVQSVNVPDREGHVIVLYEGKCVNTVFAGARYLDGGAVNEVGVVDLLNPKTGEQIFHGYQEYILSDGGKIYGRFEFTHVSEGISHGTWEFLYGTGRYEGIKGRGTWAGPNLGDRWYGNWEGEMELSR